MTTTIFDNVTMENQSEIISPWYKQFWPWFLISLPLTAVIAGISTVIIAMHNPDGVVADDYYKEGLAINRTLHSEKMARQLNIAVSGQVSSNIINKIEIFFTMVLLEEAFHDLDCFINVSRTYFRFLWKCVKYIVDVSW